MDQGVQSLRTQSLEQGTTQGMGPGGEDEEQRFWSTTSPKEKRSSLIDKGMRVWTGTLTRSNQRCTYRIIQTLVSGKRQNRKSNRNTSRKASRLYKHEVNYNL